MKHGLTGKESTYSHAIQAAYKFAVAPRFDAMSPAEAMEFEICVPDIGVNPSVRTHRTGASINHLVESMKIDRTWNEEAARKQLIQFFDTMSPTDEATIAGRRKMSAVLFS